MSIIKTFESWKWEFTKNAHFKFDALAWIWKNLSGNNPAEKCISYDMSGRILFFPMHCELQPLFFSDNVRVS